MSEKRRFRWLQFSLRVLFVLVLLVSIGMSWLAVEMARARRQREAVAAIEKAGGTVSYAFSQPSAPGWIYSSLGHDFFVDVVEVFASGAKFGDSEATYLQELPELTTLRLQWTRVTDSGLDHLKGLTNLTLLDLRGARVTDAGVENLKGLTQLECLHLDSPQVTDLGLEHLKGLTNLTLLDLRGTHITDAGVESLKKLTGLEDLYLCGTEVTSEGLKNLRQVFPSCNISFESLP